MTTIDQMVNEYVTALSDDGENSVPMATTDADEVIRSQLTENTGRHFLDSGGVYGRNWEENQDNPPWEQPRWDVHEGYVVQNVYDYLNRACTRDEFAVQLEIALYAYGYHGPGEGDSWLTCMEDFADALGDGAVLRDELEGIGVPASVAEGVAFGISPEEPPYTFNTYNFEYGTPSQTLQGTFFGGPYAEYAAVQVHGGCDVRGGYTAPRVYQVNDGLTPLELGYHCPACESFFYESCHRGWADEVVHLRHPTFPDLQEELQERGYEAGDEEIQHAVDLAHEDNEHISGGVFHCCGGGRIAHMDFA